MVKVTIYYIKNYKGDVVYTHTNSAEFADYVNKRMELGLGKYTTFEQVKNSVTDLEI
ncbi:hypothetical protein GO737_13930, partial [Staphylococcus aureus]|nr:hypothetical protein [Staphylococcus aureus]